MGDEKTARSTVLARVREREAAAMHQQQHVSLDTLFGEISAGKLKELNIILKTDVQGSIEPIRSSLERLSNEQVKVKIIHTGTGGVTETDVMLAIASKGVVIAFRGNVFANPAGLLAWISGEGDNARVRPDQKVVVMREWETPEERLKGTAVVLAEFARLADGGKKAAA